MKNFLTKNELQLVKGGYLVNRDTVPVYNAAFVEAQKKAEYIITFARLAKGKDFVGKVADSLLGLEKEVIAELAKAKTVFVSGPEKPKNELTAKLTKEALAFMSYGKDVSKTDKINNFLQSFEVLVEFEEFGLFFTEETVKLNTLYTLEEVVNAVTQVIELID